MAPNRCFLLLVLLCASVALHAQQQNLLSNPTFDFNYPPWGTNGGIDSTDWVDDPDHTGGTSGSIRLRAPQFTSRTLYQCLPVVGGASYTFSFWSYQASQVCSGGFNGNAERIYWMSSPGCPDADIITFVDSATANTPDTWEQVILANVIAPANAKSGFFLLSAYCDKFQATFEGFVDDAFLGYDVIFRDPFE